MDVSWICFLAVMLIVIPTTYYGIRSRLRYVRRIREAQAQGTFTDMNTPENEVRFRRLAILSLVGVLGIFFSITALLLLPMTPADSLYGLILVIAILFGLLATIAGLLLQREINRRL